MWRYLINFLSADFLNKFVCLVSLVFDFLVSSLFQELCEDSRFRDILYENYSYDKTIRGLHALMVCMLQGPNFRFFRQQRMKSRILLSTLCRFCVKISGH